jgi:hypothetical protein
MAARRFRGMEAAAVPSKEKTIGAALFASIGAFAKRGAGEWTLFGRRNPVIRTVILHWIIGVGTGLFCAGLLLGLDTLGIRSLLFRSDALVPGLVLLFGGFAITFGGVVSAAAVMFPDFDERDGGTGARRAPRSRAIEPHPDAQATETDEQGRLSSAPS